MMHCRNSVCITKFEDMINDFGSVIERVNSQFGTDYVPYQKTFVNQKKVFERIEAFNMNRGEAGDIQKYTSSQARKDMYKKMKFEDIASDDLARIADELYKILSEC